MSLLVNAYFRDESGSMIFLDPEDPSRERAGFESYRTTFYGGQAARTLGLRLLPKLAEKDLYVEGEERATLKVEAATISQNAEMFTREAGADCDVLRWRAQNILDAIERAEQVNGGVAIW